MARATSGCERGRGGRARPCQPVVTGSGRLSWLPRCSPSSSWHDSDRLESVGDLELGPRPPRGGCPAGPEKQRSGPGLSPGQPVVAGRALRRGLPGPADWAPGRAQLEGRTATAARAAPLVSPESAPPGTRPGARRRGPCRGGGRNAPPLGAQRALSEPEPNWGARWTRMRWTRGPPGARPAAPRGDCTCSVVRLRVGTVSAQVGLS